MHIVSKCGYVHMCICRCLQRPEEAVEAPGAGITCDDKLPDIGAGKETPEHQEKHVFVSQEQSL